VLLQPGEQPIQFVAGPQHQTLTEHSHGKQTQAHTFLDRPGGQEVHLAKKTAA
jgi:hypothetical protein